MTNGGSAAAESDKTSDVVQQAIACPQPPPVAPADATSEHFLKIDGILGESTDIKHVGEIKIGSFVWGVNLGTLMRCDKAPQTAIFSGVTFVKPLDKASPKLAEAAASGRHLPVAMLTARKVGSDQQEYLKVTFTDVVVAGYSTSAGGALPQDTFNLSFNRIHMQYFPQKPDGSLDAAVTFCWDIKESQLC